MAKRPEQEDEQPDTNGAASTPHLDRLEKLANAAATAAQAKQWRARKNGLHQQDEPSEVRTSLTTQRQGHGLKKRCGR